MKLGETMDVPVSHVDALLDFILKAADKAENSAGLGGGYGDGGASVTRNQVVMFMHGRTGTIPKQWASHYKSYLRETDPEYETFKRLEKKFV
jgi:hypothetical protein